MKEFNSEDLEEAGLTNAQINEAIAGLIDKGLLVSIEKHGETYYKLTSLGEAYGSHMDSDPLTRN